MEGIETSYDFSIFNMTCVSRCPDMEGIETYALAFDDQLWWRVSRCPDMEGIETSRNFS